MKITEEQSTGFSKEGFLVVRGAIPAAVLDAFIGVIEAEVDRRATEMYKNGEISALYQDEPFERRWYCMWRDRGSVNENLFWHACVFGRPLYALWTNPAILDVVESLLGSEIQASGDYILRPRIPSGAGDMLPWHQDSGYMKNTGRYKWPTVWVPLVPVNGKNGAMEFIPGTHSLSIQDHHRVEGEGSGFATPRVDPSEGREVVLPEMSPGDFVIFDNHLFHRSTHGSSASVRWSIDFRFSQAGTPVGDDLWFHGMRHVVRSARDPGQVPSWDGVRALWEKSEQRIANP